MASLVATKGFKSDKSENLAPGATSLRAHLLPEEIVKNRSSLVISAARSGVQQQQQRGRAGWRQMVRSYLQHVTAAFGGSGRRLVVIVI